MVEKRSSAFFSLLVKWLKKMSYTAIIVILPNIFLTIIRVIIYGDINMVSPYQVLINFRAHLQSHSQESVRVIVSVNLSMYHHLLASHPCLLQLPLLG